MAVQGYKTVLRASGTATAFTSEPFTATGSTVVANEFQITSSAREVWNRHAAAPVFRNGVGGSTISSTDIADINYLFGKVAFNSTHASVAGNGTYLPLSTIAGANSYTLTQQTDLLDDTDITSTGYRSRIGGLKDVSLTVTRWDSLDLEFYHALIGSTASGTTVVVAEIQPGGAPGPQARGYFKIESEDRSGDVGSLETADLNLMVDGDDKAAFRWSDE